jgi:hypothetical protein
MPRANLKVVCWSAAVVVAFFSGRQLGVRQTRLDRIDELDVQCRELVNEINEEFLTRFRWSREERTDIEKWIEALRSAAMDRRRERASRAKQRGAEFDRMQE